MQTKIPVRSIDVVAAPSTVFSNGWGIRVIAAEQQAPFDTLTIYSDQPPVAPHRDAQADLLLLLATTNLQDDLFAWHPLVATNDGQWTATLSVCLDYGVADNVVLQAIYGDSEEPAEKLVLVMQGRGAVPTAIQQAPRAAVGALLSTLDTAAAMITYTDPSA